VRSRPAMWDCHKVFTAGELAMKVTRLVVVMVCVCSYSAGPVFGGPQPAVDHGGPELSVKPKF